MRESICKVIIVFGVSFLLINLIGHIFKISSFVTLLMNPNGAGGYSTSNIPTILSTLITIIVGVARYFFTKDR